MNKKMKFREFTEHQFKKSVVQLNSQVEVLVAKNTVARITKSIKKAGGEVRSYYLHDIHTGVSKQKVKNGKIIRESQEYTIHRPMITVVLIKDKDGKFHRGISVCHPKDNPCKIMGKRDAILRATFAMQTKANIKSRMTEEAENLFDECAGELAWPSTLKVRTDIFLGQYNIELLPVEFRMWNKPETAKVE